MGGESTSQAGPSNPSHTHIGQYSSNPRHLRQNKCREGTSISSGRAPQNFAEAPRIGICLKCHHKLSPRHLCHLRSIRNNVRNRLKDGEPAVHIVSYLVDALENENNSEDEDNVHDIQYGEEG